MQTEKLYYEDAYIREFEAEVISCSRLTDGKDGTVFAIELDRTAFYPEGGGQTADTGYMCIDGNDRVRILDTREKEGRILHYADYPIEPGTKVEGLRDWDRRFEHMQEHRGEHIVSGMICKRFICDNIGFHMGSDTVIIDYNADVDRVSLNEIEAEANRYIWEAHESRIFFPDKEELDKLHYRSKKEIAGDVRITEFPGADICACCGTHVKNSAEVGLVKFISLQHIGKGTRIGLLSGKRALDFLSMNFEQNSEVAKAMAASLDKTASVYLKQKEELKEAKFRASEAEEKYLKYEAEKYRDKGNVLVFEDGLTADGVRKYCVILGETAGGRCAVFSRDKDAGFKYAVIYPGHDIREFIKTMNSALNGRGGGKDGFAQGSVQAEEGQIREFFSSVLA